MSRELIVSVNGKEKKIAIVENDRVTEFYIERGEQNQGIVGNIYKGRVMRVLPGMQSAFVDIGLERDAFLYVTDFFDEEAEFERIVGETVIDRLDHKNLNVEVPEFRELNPSVENIAMVIYRLLKPQFQTVAGKLASVTVWETPKTWCEYSE